MNYTFTKSHRGDIIIIKPRRGIPPPVEGFTPSRHDRFCYILDMPDCILRIIGDPTCKCKGNKKLYCTLYKKVTDKMTCFKCEDREDDRDLETTSTG